MKKKIFVTRRLLKENEEKLKDLFDVSLNKDDKIYTAQEIISGSKDYDGILSSVTDPITADTISKLSDTIKIIACLLVFIGVYLVSKKRKGHLIPDSESKISNAN